MRLLLIFLSFKHVEIERTYEPKNRYWLKILRDLEKHFCWNINCYKDLLSIVRRQKCCEKMRVYFILHLKNLEFDGNIIITSFLFDTSWRSQPSFAIWIIYRVIKMYHNKGQ